MLLHVPVMLHSDVKENTSIQRSCSLECWEYQVLLLYIHVSGRETSSWRDEKCSGLIFIDKVWGCISKNRAGAGLEHRLASVTCDPAPSFLLCNSVQLELGRLHWLEPRPLHRTAASDHWCLCGITCSATVSADNAEHRFYHVYSLIKQLYMSEQ